MTNTAPSFFNGDGLTENFIRQDHSGPIGGFADIALAPDGTIGLLENWNNTGNAWTFRTLDQTGVLIGTSSVAEIDFGGNGANVVLAQADGSFLVAAHYGDCTIEPCSEWRIHRFNADGTRDMSFGSGGTAEVFNYAGSHVPTTVALLNGGGFVVGGTYNDNLLMLAWFDDDGGLQSTRQLDFSTLTGLAPTATRDIFVLPDDRLLLTVETETGAVVARFTTDGDLDLSFGGGDGLVEMEIASEGFIGHAVVRLDDGGFVMAGEIGGDFALIAHTADGEIDTSFGGGDGIVITPVGSIGDSARAVTIGEDGMIYVTGFTHDPAVGGFDFVAVRYDDTGVQDMSYGGGDGIVRIADMGEGAMTLPQLETLGSGLIDLQDDGSLLVTFGFGILRIDPFGNIDRAFGGSSTLGETVSLIGSNWVILDPDVEIYDAALSAANNGQGNFDGASLTIERSAGVVAEDSFGFQFSSISTLQQFDNTILNNGVVIATFTESSGQLQVTFTASNGETPTTALVNEVMQSVTFSNSSPMPPASIELLWTFNDGNQGGQGDGGALIGTGTTEVILANPNDPPEISETLSDNRLVEGWHAQTVAVGSFTVTDPDGDHLSLAVDDPRFGVRPTGTTGVYELYTLPNTNIDFEQEPSIVVHVTASETWTSEGLESGQSFTINVTDVSRENFHAGVATEDLVMIALGAGNMTLAGGAGDDILTTDRGDDVLLGGAGADVLNGGDGDDYLHGGTAFDTLNGGAGDDSIIGGIGADTVNGGDGHDTLYSNTGRDEINGGAGDDFISPGDGDDTVYAGDGNDTVLGRSGRDLIYGETGDDLLTGAEGIDTLDGGAGDDHLRGGTGWDILIGGDGVDLLYGNAGSDSLLGGAGDDYLAGATGDDTLRGGAGNDRIHGNQGRDVIEGGAGDDDLRGGTLADEFIFAAGDGHDTISDFEHFQDAVLLDAALVGSATTGAEVIAQYGDTSSGMAVLDFGSESITLSNLTDFDDMADNIFVV